MKRIDSLAENLIKPINPSIIVLLGIYTILWGVWIMFFPVFDVLPSFAPIASFTSKEAMGVVAWSVGVFICRGAFSPSYSNIRIGSALAAAHWLFFGIMLMIGQFQDPIGLSSIFFGIYAALVWMNLGVNKHLYSKNKK